MVSVTRGAVCLSIGNPALSPGTRLSLALLAGPVPGAEAQVTAAGCPGVEAGDPALHGYAVQLNDSSARAYLPALAVVGGRTTFTRNDGALSADLDGDGRTEAIRACTSTEGVHFTIWAGEALRSQRLWHHYSYLGYDVESSCTPADTAGVKP